MGQAPGCRSEGARDTRPPLARRTAGWLAWGSLQHPGGTEASPGGSRQERVGGKTVVPRSVAVSRPGSPGGSQGLGAWSPKHGSTGAGQKGGGRKGQHRRSEL